MVIKFVALEIPCCWVQHRKLLFNRFIFFLFNFRRTYVLYQLKRNNCGEYQLHGNVSDGVHHCTLETNEENNHQNKRGCKTTAVILASLFSSSSFVFQCRFMTRAIVHSLWNSASMFSYLFLVTKKHFV